MTTKSTEEKLRAALDDATSHLECMRETLSGIAGMFEAIKMQTTYGTKDLAEIGRYVAEDFANLADGWSEEAQNVLNACGAEDRS